MNQAFSKIWIVVIFTFIVGVGGIALLSCSSVLRIPVFSEIFYGKKIADLGIEFNPELAEGFIQKLGFITSGVAPLIPPEVPVDLSQPRTISMSDVEFTSGVEKIYQEYFKCPFENFQIKFEKGKYRSSAHLLKPIEGDVTVLGTVTKKDEKSIEIELEKAWLGNIPLPENIKEKIEKISEEGINRILKEKTEGLRIDDIEILDGEMLFKGIIFFKWIEEIKNVLCRAQYSASIGGRNEPIPEANILVKEIETEISTTYITDEYGQVYIPFKIGNNYQIEVNYKNITKTVTLEYKGGITLFISIDPNKPEIVEIEFAAPLPSVPR